MTEKECRICLENDNLDDLISPCRCSGTSKWVHRKCLEEWRNESNNIRAKKYCMECNYKYKVTLNHPLEFYNINCCINRNPLSYILFVFLIAYPISYIFYGFDQYNNYLSVKIYNYNQTFIVDNIVNILKQNQLYLDLYYHSITISVYSNVFVFVFLLLAHSKVKRKRLYFKLMYKYLLLCLFCINNNLYLSFFLNCTTLYEFGFFVQSGLCFYSLILNTEIVIKHNKIIQKMNNIYNESRILDYCEDIESEFEVDLESNYESEKTSDIELEVVNNYVSSESDELLVNIMHNSSS